MNISVRFLSYTLAERADLISAGRRVYQVKGNMEERARTLALYIIENRATVRAAAKKFGISKSTVHKDLAQRLALYDRALYLAAKEVLEENKAQRHIRGGIATRKKYRGE